MKSTKMYVSAVLVILTFRWLQPVYGVPNQTVGRLDGSTVRRSSPGGGWGGVQILRYSK